MTKRGKGNNHRKDKPLSKSTIRLQIAYLRKVLNKALKEGRIASNLASRVGEEYKQAANLHEDINPLVPKNALMPKRKSHELKYLIEIPIPYVDRNGKRQSNRKRM